MVGVAALVGAATVPALSSLGSASADGVHPVRRRSSSVGLDEDEATPPPMKIIASICEDGLGLLSWWEAEEEEEDDDEEEDPAATAATNDGDEEEMQVVEEDALEEEEEIVEEDAAAVKAEKGVKQEPSWHGV